MRSTTPARPTTTAVPRRWPPPRPADGPGGGQKTAGWPRATGEQHQDQDGQDRERAQQLPGSRRARRTTSRSPRVGGALARGGRASTAIPRHAADASSRSTGRRRSGGQMVLDDHGAGNDGAARHRHGPDNSGGPRTCGSATSRDGPPAGSIHPERPARGGVAAAYARVSSPHDRFTRTRPADART